MIDCLDGSDEFLDLTLDGHPRYYDGILTFPRLDAAANVILEVVADVEEGHRSLKILPMYRARLSAPTLSLGQSTGETWRERHSPMTSPMSSCHCACRRSSSSEHGPSSSAGPVACDRAAESGVSAVFGSNRFTASTING
jgi:hypothetical protein